MNERTVFLAALEIDDPERRAAYVREACGDNADLRRSVEELFQANAAAGSFMDTPAATLDTANLDAHLESPISLDFLAASDQPGSLGRLGTYEITRLIGQGGMGIVLEGRDTRLERVVAIKVLTPQLAATAAARRRFLREAKAAAAVRDEHVVTIYAVEEAAGIPYLVMELIAGTSLQERIDRDGPLELQEILRIGMQTARGLAAAHSQGLIHRDVKPANILLENGVERVKLTDFGLARVVDDASLTQTGVIAGTPQYMAPEQAKGEAVDAKADLFSLGSVLYAMCTGRPPFRASTTLGVLKRVCEDALSPIRDSNPSIPDWLVSLIEKLHAKDPAERNLSAAEIAELLGQHLAALQDPSAVRLVARLPKPRKSAPQRNWMIAAAAVVLLVFGISLTEATGVSRVLPTVLRVFTGEGTLVVETAPDVQVTVEGNGDLVFGIGGQSIRVPSGSYRVKATKGGKPLPLESDLVTVSRGREEVVRVRLEQKRGIENASTTEKGAFVLLGGETERKFDTLAEAVQSASDGDTIDIRGNGPFVTRPILIAQGALTIRGGDGFRPLISADPEEDGSILIQSRGTLVLEGLDLQWINARPFDASSKTCRLVVANGPAACLHVLNCRLAMNRREGQHAMSCVGGFDSKLCRLRNCQLMVSGRGTIYPAFDFGGASDSALKVENCLLVQNIILWVEHPQNMEVVLKHNTFVGSRFLAIRPENPADVTDEELAQASANILASANIFSGSLGFVQSQESLSPANQSNAKNSEQALQSLVRWRDHANVFSSPDGDELLKMGLETASGHGTDLRLTAPITSLSSWHDFWGSEQRESQRGPAQFAGGQLMAKAAQSPRLLVPEDFRLLADSPGYRALPDGKDVGADVDLVGPGAAYERWKETPEYQEWLKESGQVKQ